MFLIGGLILFFTILIFYQLFLAHDGRYSIIEGMDTNSGDSSCPSCQDFGDLTNVANVGALAKTNAIAIDDLKKRVAAFDPTSLQTQIDLLKKDIANLQAQASANAEGQAAIANNFASTNSTPITGANAYAPGPSLSQ
jgi:hypothetical protein